jgi:CDP-paratose 2-epimerase
MKILITGICGFAGTALAERLRSQAEGLELVGIDNLMRPGAEINRRRMRRLGVRFFHGDLRVASDVSALPACDWVIDAAANPSVLAGVGDKAGSRQLFEHNLASLGNVLEYCRQHGAGLVLLSTSRVFSIDALASLPLAEKDGAFVLDAARALPAGVSASGIDTGFPTTPPLSLYGATKLASEVMALEWGGAFDFPVWINRCSVLAGAGQFGTPEQGIFSYWLNAHLRRRPLRYIGFQGKGLQTRDALHPGDLAELLLRQMRCTRTGGQRVYVAGGGPANAISLAQLTAWCDARFGPHPVTPDPLPRRFDVPWVAMDNAHAMRDFGWQLRTPLAAILEEVAAHAEAHPDWLELSGV